MKTIPKIKRSINTKEKGMVEFLFYKEKSTFVGVCLTFDIVEENKDVKTLMHSITEAASLHLETVIKYKMADALLNRYAPISYWNKYFKLANQITKHSPKQISKYHYLSNLS